MRKSLFSLVLGVALTGFSSNVIGQENRINPSTYLAALPSDAPPVIEDHLLSQRSAARLKFLKKLDKLKVSFPFKILKPFLNEHGSIREEFMEQHYAFMDNNGTPYYNRSYNTPRGKVIEQYNFFPKINMVEGSSTTLLSIFPNTFYFDGIWYADPNSRGISGDEVKADDWKKLIKETIIEGNQ